MFSQQRIIHLYQLYWICHLRSFYSLLPLLFFILSLRYLVLAALILAFTSFFAFYTDPNDGGYASLLVFHVTVRVRTR